MPILLVCIGNKTRETSTNLIVYKQVKSKTMMNRFDTIVM